jgi:hypothetical protein
VVLSRTFEPPDLLVASVTGQVTARDQATVVEWIRLMLRTVGEVRLLVVLHDFQGWKQEASFANPTLWLHDHERVSKIAIVGCPEWRPTLLTFTAQPLRRIPIDYFETEAAARRWLGVAAAGT